MQKVIAHRGACGYAPENTLEAFQLAVDMGADGVELDVHLSKDDELIVAHDETIDRVSNGSGLIRDMTLRQLKRFAFNRTMPACEKGTLPTLGEVFELLKPTGLMINVELKNTIFDYPGLEEKCIDLAGRLGMTERVLYSSFNHHSLLRVKRIDPSLRCGILYEATMIEPWTYAKAHGFDALHPHFTELRVPGECERAHEMGLLVNPWTVNEEEHLRMVFSLGADMVITNYPDRARRALMAQGEKA